MPGYHYSEQLDLHESWELETRILFGHGNRSGAGPSRAKLQDTKHAINFHEAIGNFSFSLSVPIRIGDSVFLEAIAKEGTLTYRGSASGSVTTGLPRWTSARSTCCQAHP